MIAEIGLFALILALFVAAVQATVPLDRSRARRRAWMNVDRPAAFAQFCLVAISFGALIWLHVTSDFSVLNVVENSHTDKPLLYKITGVWGNHEGSMMLWTFILVLYGLAVSVFGRNLPPGLRARALAVQGMIGFGFLLFILLTSNPFVRVDPAPLNGNGLNPLLQDPGLAFHPPFALSGLCRFLDGVFVRHRRPDRRPRRCRLGALGAALDVGGVVRADAGRRHGRRGGPITRWAGAAIGHGTRSRTPRFMPWLAGTALAAFVDRGREA